MYRPSDTGNGIEFGYIQPSKVAELPKEGGKHMVISQNSDGKPIYGPVEVGFSLCSRAKNFTTRSADPTVDSYFTPNSTTVQEFLVVPDNEPNWRAPCCGIMIVNYCVNPKNQTAGGGEIDVTCLLDNETYAGPIDHARERVDCTHSTWQWTAANSDCSESCGAAKFVTKGRTLKLHARDTGDDGVGMSARAGQWRVHAVKAVFIPLEVE